jgi:hypothetical protein
MVLGGCQNTMAEHRASPLDDAANSGLSMLQDVFWKISRVMV